MQGFVFPDQDRNNRDELVFDLHPAKLLLREIVESGENEQMTPSDFQATSPEYMLFKPHKFKERIYQEVKHKKYLYCLEHRGFKKGRSVECLLMTLVTLTVIQCKQKYSLE
jgi:hypothetical protein